MDIVTDLHLHSKYSRAVSPQMVLETMEKVALQKGIDLLSISDWTHPLWFKEIREKVEETTDGIYKLKFPIAKEVLFLVSTEISCIYKQEDKLRRIHVLVFLSTLEKAGEVTKELLKRGANLSADGRPIIGMSARNLLELVLSIDERAMLIPAHAWTPHFGVYGSASGFDSLTDCFGDLAPYVYGIETGLSSDPEMNWQIPELEKRSILSFSDAHSLPKMGREVTVLIDDRSQVSGDSFTYEDVRLAIMKKPGKLKVSYTVEFYPEEGKYHFSGHRNCHVSYSLEEVKEKGVICPVCTKRLTEGVFIRLSQLASVDNRVSVKEEEVKWYTDSHGIHPPYVKVVPLYEVIAECLGVKPGSKKGERIYLNLLQECGSEFDILLKTPLTDIARVAGERVAEGIDKNRKGEIHIIPGFDGEYGKITLWNTDEVSSQLSIFT